MFDPRNVRLAQILIDYSIKVRTGEKVLINCYSTAGLPLAKEAYKIILKRGGLPYLDLSPGDLSYYFFKHASLDQIKAKPEIGLFLAKWADKFVSIVAEKNDRELANIDPQKVLMKSKINEPIREIIMQKPWILTYYPTFSMAQTANMSLEEMEDFYFKASLRDWNKESKTLEKLKKALDRAHEIRVLGEKTDLTLSFTNRLFQICSGQYNMPDGEVFSCPLETKTEGRIYYDFPTLYQGKEVTDVSLVFKAGKVIDFDAGKNKEFLAKTLDLDAGSRTLGEFAIGTNYGITTFILNTLFDEKIGGTVHLALGSAYPEKEPGGGKNKSAIHWDMVKDMRKKGSQVSVDGKIVLKDGKIFGL